MTKIQLEKLNIYPTFPGKDMYYVQGIGDIKIWKTDKLEDIFISIYKLGLEIGKEAGKIDKIREIKSILDIQIEEL